MHVASQYDARRFGTQRQLRLDCLALDHKAPFLALWARWNKSHYCYAKASVSLSVCMPLVIYDKIDDKSSILLKRLYYILHSTEFL